MLGKIITNHPVPLFIWHDFPQYWKTARHEAFDVVIKQLAIDVHATIFYIRWAGILLRIADMRSKGILGLFEVNPVSPGV